jgi:hypothetical protein
LPPNFAVNKLPREKRFTKELSHSVPVALAAFQRINPELVLQRASSKPIDGWIACRKPPKRRTDLFKPVS